MKIIDYKRGNDEGGILINGKDQYIAVTVSTSKKFKSLRGAQKFLESYGYKEVRGKHSIGGTQYRSKDRNSRAEVYPGGQDEYGRDLFRVELREDNGHVEELYMTKTKLNRWLDQFGFKPSHQIGKSRSGRKPRVRGFHDEWYVVIEKNLPRRTSRMIDYDYGEENMYDNVVMKILDWAYDNNDKALIKSLNNLKNSKDFVKRTGSKIPYGYSTDIYGDKEWEILEVSKENFEELGEEYPDIYDRFKDDFDEEDIDY